MAEINYLPFAYREIQTFPILPAASYEVPLVSTKISSLALSSMVGKGRVERIFLQDLIVTPWLCARVAQVPTWLPDLVDPLAMRVGYQGKGFLLEERHQSGNFLQRPLQFSNHWNFVKPYRIYPGEILQVNYESALGAAGNNVIFPGVLFNGVKVKPDGTPGLPCPLTESADNLDATGIYVWSGKGLTCPGDGPLDIYGVSMTGMEESTTTLTWNSPFVQIAGPDGRDWFKKTLIMNEGWPVLGLQFSRQMQDGWWVTGGSQSMELGEERGWVMGRDEVFVAEFQKLVALTVNTLGAVSVTLRGSIEVVND